MEQKPKADGVWNLLVDSSRLAVLDEYMGDMNIPLMIAMGDAKIPKDIDSLADALGVSKELASGFVLKWSLDNGVIEKDLFNSLMA